MLLIRWLTAYVWIAAVICTAPDLRADDVPTFADRPDDEIRDSDRNFGFLLNPLAIALGVYGGEADFVIGRYAALAVEADLYRRNDGTGIALGAGLLVYPLGSALHQLYVEPRVVYARPWSETFPQMDWGSDAVGLGATAGWQWTWDYGFSVRLGGGALYFIGDSRSNSAVRVGMQLVLDGSMGWSF
ncbi:MAG: hypothetical protein M3O46_01505 [Myxococcota bacterium]|nr:hypothetical protein [Myxococcota bacterium]